jgi:nicotinate-nucleotide adenylyltransferase
MRLAVLGGSFDPVHLGHLWMAVFAREQLELDSVVMIPAAAPPHKDSTVAPYRFRIGLLRALAVRREWLVPSELEADPDRPSYTVDTLRQIRSSLGKRDRVWLLVGADSLDDFSTWKEPETITELARLAVYRRPGVEATGAGGAKVDWIDGPLCGLSSSLIRARLRRGASVDGMVPAEIVAEIESAPHYRGESGDA